ncbi:MAG: GNAT family N-acetyltransferase [Actinobacteria bacterium]|nr:MAG: GNAT family N-acetyltransferase [Actinomycetota bacterium]
MAVELRTAGPADADRVAGLHVASWRRHYRGAYADSFLDSDVVDDRRALWSGRLADPTGRLTVVAEDGAELVGFVHVVFDDDDRWGSLIDNLHVRYGRQRTGIGTTLLARAGAAVADRATAPAMYLWVLEQNVAAQRFYRALGGTFVESASVTAPGGVPGRLNGSPKKLRFAWPEAAELAGAVRTLSQA